MKGVMAVDAVGDPQRPRRRGDEDRWRRDRSKRAVSREDKSIVVDWAMLIS